MKTTTEIHGLTDLNIDRSSTRWMLKNFERTPRLAELKVSYRRRQTRPIQKKEPVITSAMSCEAYLRSVWDSDTLELREEFILICLSNSCEVLGWVKLFTGGFDSNPVDMRLLLGVALQTASSAIIVAHNHPSGSLEPSSSDRMVTERIAKACKYVGLRFLDHLIVTRNASYSFSEKEPWLFDVSKI